MLITVYGIRKSNSCETLTFIIPQIGKEDLTCMVIRAKAAESDYAILAL